MERRANPIPVRLTTIVGSTLPTIAGLAAVFYDPTDPEGTQYRLPFGALERIMPGAFKQAIRRDDVRALFNHDASRILGRNKAHTLRLWTDSRGLRYEIRPGETKAGRDTVAHVRRGDVSGSSFAFEVTDEEWREDLVSGEIIREVRAVKLHDVGPVTYPAYKATTTGLRHVRTEDCDGARVALARWKLRDARHGFDHEHETRARLAAAMAAG